MNTTAATDMDFDVAATAALLGELDGDLEFFDGLFQDLPASEDLGLNTPPPSSASSLAVVIKSDRRRQRWLALHQASSSWRDVAKTQKRARETAETENAELRRLVTLHERAAAKMMKLLHKATALSARELVVPPVVAMGIPFLGPPADMGCITRSLDALALSAATLLPAGATASTELRICGFQNRIVNDPSGDALESTVEMEWALPFSVDAITSAVVTHSLRLVTRKQVPSFTTIHESDSFKVVQAVTKAKEKNGVVITKHGQLAARREPQRQDGSQLVLLESRGGFYMDTTRVVTIDGDSCILVSPVPGHDHTTLGPLSRIRWFRRFRMQPETSPKLSEADRSSWMNLFSANSAKKTDRQIDKLSLTLENCLLDATVATKSS